MPAVHNYECPDCGCYFEAFFEFMDDAEETHPCIKCMGYANRTVCAPKFKVNNKLTKGGPAPKLADKKFAKEFTEEHYNRTVKRMENSGKNNYAFYDYDETKDKSKNKPRRLTQDELNRKIKNAQEITIEAHKRAGKLDKLGKKK